MRHLEEAGKRKPSLNFKEQPKTAFLGMKSCVKLLQSIFFLSNSDIRGKSISYISIIIIFLYFRSCITTLVNSKTVDSKIGLLLL